MTKHTETADTLILGGGFSGLWCSYETGGLALSDGSAASHRKDIDRYIFLRYDVRNRRMLRSLGLPTERRKLTVGFHSRGRTYSKPTPEMVDDYLQKAYPQRDHSKVSSLYFIPYWYVCTTPYSSILERLTEQAHSERRIHEGQAWHVSRIDLRRREVQVPWGTVRYEALVSTLPLPTFLKLAGRAYLIPMLQLNATPVLFYSVPSIEQQYTVIMDMNRSSPVLRWTITDGACTEERLVPTPLDHEGKLLFALPNAKIEACSEDAKAALLAGFEAHGVFMCGRFAEWCAHYDTEDTVARVDHIREAL